MSAIIQYIWCADAVMICEVFGTWSLHPWYDPRPPSLSEEHRFHLRKARAFDSWGYCCDAGHCWMRSIILASLFSNEVQKNNTILTQRHTELYLFHWSMASVPFSHISSHFTIFDISRFTPFAGHQVFLSSALCDLASVETCLQLRWSAARSLALGRQQKHRKPKQSGSRRQSSWNLICDP